MVCLAVSNSQEKLKEKKEDFFSSYTSKTWIALDLKTLVNFCFILFVLCLLLLAKTIKRKQNPQNYYVPSYLVAFWEKDFRYWKSKIAMEKNKT